METKHAISIKERTYKIYIILDKMFKLCNLGVAKNGELLKNPVNFFYTFFIYLIISYLVSHG